MGNLMQQVIGRADITVNSNGILISKDKKDDVNDLIDEAIQHNGQLPVNVTPVAPVQRVTRQPVANPTPRPATQTAVQPPPTATPTPTPR
jgi:hypothetical protein